MALDQTHFRIRPHDGPALNANTGADWAAATNTVPTPNMDFAERVRVRFGVTATAGETEGFQLWYSIDGGAYAVVPNNVHFMGQDLPLASEVAVVPSDQYTDGAATTQLITSGTFVAGTGNEDNTTTTVALATNEVTELEWCVIVHKLSDGQTHLAAGQTVSFRVYRDAGTPLDTYTQTPTVTIGWRDGWIGGAFPEMGGDLGPLVVGTDYYMVCEFSESNNLIVMMKSTDSGLSWNAMDPSNGPTQGDFEGCHCVVQGTTIYVFHKVGGSPAYLHQFNTSTDLWGTVDETIDAAPGAKVNSVDQIFAVYRPGLSDFVVFYHGTGASGGGVWVRSGNPGAWDTRFELDTTASVDFLAATAVVISDVVHVFYLDWTNGTIWYNTIAASATLTATDLGTRESFATGLSTSGTGAGGQFSNPPCLYNDGGTNKIAVSWIDAAAPDHCQMNVYTVGTGKGTQRQASDAAVADEQADHEGAWHTQTVADGTDLYTFWMDDADGDIYYAVSANGAEYGTPVKALALLDVVPHDYQVYPSATGTAGRIPGFDALQAKNVGSGIGLMCSWAQGGSALYYNEVITLTQPQTINVAPFAPGRVWISS